MELLVTNVNEAFGLGVNLFKESYTNTDKFSIVSPRGMQTIEYKNTWATIYLYPSERVLFHEGRDANPFFHFMEGLWMLAGRRDVGWISQFNSKISQYSDNGITFNAAYGFRLRRHFLVDQLSRVIKILKKNPDSRRAACIIFDPTRDYFPTKDVPCNGMLTFKIRNGELNMTVYNRSNDLIWGAYGANAVHFSMIMEYVAGKIGVLIGRYIHVTDCMHLYTDNPNWKNILNDSNSLFINAYDNEEIAPYPMINIPGTWDIDLEVFMEKGIDGLYHDHFFKRVAVPMLRTWQAHKTERNGLEFVDDIRATDWHKACKEWLQRRYSND